MDGGPATAVTTAAPAAHGVVDPSDVALSVGGDAAPPHVVADSIQSPSATEEEEGEAFVEDTDSAEEEDAEARAHERPQEFRLWWSASGEDSAKAFAEALERMEAMISPLLAGGKGFVIETPRVDQYFCAGPTCGPKAAMRKGEVSMEVKNLKSVSDNGCESWEKMTGADISTYTKLPWVSLQKTRRRLKAKQVTTGTRLEGLKALETTEIKVLNNSLNPAATGSFQSLRCDDYLTIAVEGLPAIIELVVAELKLIELVSGLSGLALSNFGASGLYRHNVSYPRFISVASVKAESDREFRMCLGAAPEARKAFNDAQQRMEALLGIQAVGGHGFNKEEPHVHQYFCAGPACAPKVSMGDGDDLDVEVMILKDVSENGCELWEKQTGVDVSTYTKLPWVSFRKTRNRCCAQGSRFEGLTSLEATEIDVVDKCIYSSASGGAQRLKSEAYLTLAVEGTSAAIESVVSALRLEELAPHVLSNADGEGLYRHNVSYPRLISIASESATSSTFSPATVPAVFSYTQFLERFRHPSAQPVVNEVRDFVMAFPSNLTRLQAARKIHEFLTTATDQLLATEVFAEDAGRSEEIGLGVAEGLEKFVVHKLHKLLFRHAPCDLREDERVEQCIRSSSMGSLPPELSSESRELLATAVRELGKIDQYRAPRDKVVCMLNGFRMAEGLVEEESRRPQGGAAAGTNGGGEGEPFLRRVLAALVIQAAPQNLYSNIEFATAFRHPTRVNAEERRCLKEFTAVLAAIAPGGPHPPAADAEAAAGAGGELLKSPDDLPVWLSDVGVTLRFEKRTPGDILIGEVDGLLEEYHRMAKILREVSENRSAAAGNNDASAISTEGGQSAAAP